MEKKQRRCFEWKHLNALGWNRWKAFVFSKFSVKSNNGCSNECILAPTGGRCSGIPGLFQQGAEEWVEDASRVFQALAEGLQVALADVVG